MLFLTLPQALQGGRDAAGVGTASLEQRGEETQDGLNRDGAFTWKSIQDFVLKTSGWRFWAVPGAEDAGCGLAEQIPSLPNSTISSIICSFILSGRLQHWASPSPPPVYGRSFPSTIHPHLIITLIWVESEDFA